MVVIPVRMIELPRTACRASFVAALTTLALPFAAAQDQPSPQEPAITVSVQQPRAFGYVIGDRLEQRISLLAPAGFALDPKSLPRAGRTGLWLELAPPHLTSDKLGEATRYRLTLDYQVINVPEQVRTIDVPALGLTFSARGSQLTATVDEWPITIAPITPTYILARAGLAQTQPDAPPPTLDTARYMWLTLLWIALILAIVATILVHRHGIPWLRHGVRPFARAARDIAKLSRLPPERATYRRGLQRLHRAFDAAAGHAVFGDRLAPLFAAHPELLGLRRDIEQFYAASQREFFGAPADAAGLGEVWALAARCRDAEAAAARRPAAGVPAAADRRPHALQ
jgi:mxaA protein